MPYYLETDTDSLPNEPGVYRLILLTTRHKPKPLARVGGTDKSGVLYIGRSRNLRARLRGLRRMLFDGAAAGHVAGRTYKVSLPIQKIASPSRIAFRFTPCDDYCDKEQRMLRRYFREFGEVPPLNGRAEFISTTIGR